MNTRVLTVVQTALHLAKLGFFVGPLKPGTKNPGSRLHGSWTEKTSNTRADVLQWFRESPTDGLFLHVGKSGLIAFDLDQDNLELLPLEISNALKEGLFQRSRGKSDRGHYVFRTSERFGNSAGGFAAWGDVRGANGAIVLAPTVHPVTGKPYKLVRGSWENLPQLPAALRQLLRAGGEQQKEALTDEEISAYLSTHVSGDDLDLLESRCHEFHIEVVGGSARHSALLPIAVQAMQDARRGLYPAADAIKRLQIEFNRSFEADLSGRRSAPAPGEFDGIVRWAAAQLDGAESATELFERSDELFRVRRFAQEHMVSPLGLLAVGLARALVALPPNRVLPSVVGSAAPLNFFVALVGPSGAGKGATEDLGNEVFPFSESVALDVHSGRPGSSEGIPKMYGHMKTEKSGKRSKLVPEFLRSRVLASLPEVDTLAALMGRDGNILSATLREVWTGSRFGLDYAHASTKFLVGGKRYRFCMIVGVQPGRASAILQGRSGGLPQRFLWASVTVGSVLFLKPTLDRTDLKPVRLPEIPGEAENTRDWRVRMLTDAGSDELVELEIPEEVRAQILQARELSMRELISDAEGHRLLTQEKLAVAFAVLHGRTDGFGLDHWDMAGLMMRASDETLARIHSELAAVSSRSRRREAEEAGRLRNVRSESEERALRLQVRNRLLQLLEQSDKISRSALRRPISERQRSVFDAVLSELRQDGMVGQKIVQTGNQAPSTFYFLKSGT